MGKNVVADEHLTKYFYELANESQFSIGLIAGQPTSTSYYIIHLAKTPILYEKYSEPIAFATIYSSNKEVICQHAKFLSRMLPGGLFLLGMFIITPDEVVVSQTAIVSTLLLSIENYLSETKHLCSNYLTCYETLVVNYSKNQQKFISKLFNMKTNVTKTVDILFMPEAIQLNEIQCNVHIEEAYHIYDNEEHGWPIKRHMELILDSIQQVLDKSKYLFDGQFRDSQKCLHHFKQNETYQHGDSDKFCASMNVSIIQPCVIPNRKDFVISDCNNEMRIFGQIVCNVFAVPTLCIGDIINAMKQDIMRSLSTRLEMHCISLTEEEHTEDVNSVHEPPRRVFIRLPNTRITISDYLFPGESIQDARTSLEEMLHIRIGENVKIIDVEGHAPILSYYTVQSDSDITLSSQHNSETDQNKSAGRQSTYTYYSFYYVAVFFAVFVLIIALVMHFFTKW